jgi:PAS domain S-box-containing protein
MTTPDDAGAASEHGHQTPPPGRADEPSSVDDLLAQLVHTLADAVVIADPEGTIVFWNEAAGRLFGWSAAEARGRTLDLVIPERLRERHWAGYRETMATGRTRYGERLLEVPALRRDGEPLSIAFTVTLLHRPGDTRPSAIAAVLRDDTERWQERRALKAEIARLRGPG